MKWYVYLICFGLVLSGIFCGIRLFTLMNSESYVNGSIDITNKFSMESFRYSSTSVEFYHDLYGGTDAREFAINLLPVVDFNGQKYEYEIVLNNYTLFDVQITAGSVLANIQLDFYDTDGVKVCEAPLVILIKFLSDKTTLTISTIGGLSASYLTQYFSDNGILIKINQQKGGL